MKVEWEPCKVLAYMYRLAHLGRLFKARANPGLVRILISVLLILGKFVILYCMSFCFEFKKFQTLQNISSEKHFYTRKSNTFVIVG